MQPLRWVPRGGVRPRRELEWSNEPARSPDWCWIVRHPGQPPGGVCTGAPGNRGDGDVVGDDEA